MADIPSAGLSSECTAQPCHWLRYLFFLVVVRPLMLLGIGLNTRHRARLPCCGPAIVVANHNSHLDTLALITLFGMRRLHLIRPVAAADYFLKNRNWRWFSLRVMGILPLDRQVRGHSSHPLAPLSAALETGKILLLFPEGTRGEPERRQPLQPGIAHLAKLHPQVPIVPVFLHGLGKSLPRGEGLLVPFICDIFIGEALTWSGDKQHFLRQLDENFDQLAAESRVPAPLGEG